MTDIPRSNPVARFLRRAISCNPWPRVDLWKLQSELANMAKDGDSFPAEHYLVPDLLKEIKERFDHGEVIADLSIPGDTAASKFQIDAGGGSVNRVRVNRRDAHISLENCKLGKFEVTGSNTFIDFKNCDIGVLNLTKGAFCRLNLENTNVIALHLEVDATYRLEATSGAIGYVNVNVGSGETPFRGIVGFNDVFFATNIADSPSFKSAQTFSTLRRHMEEMETAPAAHLMRGLELEAERAGDRGLNKVFSYFYGIFAGYGLRPFRSVAGLALSIFVVGLTIGHWDGGDLAAPDWSYAGFRIPLVENCYARGMFLALQAPFQPLGLFFPGQLVVASTLIGKVVLIVHGLFCDGLLILMFMSVRRRFKLGT